MFAHKRWGHATGSKQKPSHVHLHLALSSTHASVQLVRTGPPTFLGPAITHSAAHVLFEPTGKQTSTAPKATDRSVCSISGPTHPPLIITKKQSERLPSHKGVLGKYGRGLMTKICAAANPIHMQVLPGTGPLRNVCQFHKYLAGPDTG